MTASNADAPFRFDTSYDTRDARLSLTARRSTRRTFAEATWSNVFNASERNGFLLMHSWQGARLRVPIDELQRAGLYERVRAIADARSPIAKR